MTGSNFVKLVILVRIHHLAHQVVIRTIAENSGRSVEFLAQSVLCQPVRVQQDMARGNKLGQLPGGKPIVPSSTDEKEDVQCLDKLLPLCPCGPAFL